MKTEARILADSISPDGHRLTTLQICAPRFILAEINTHRVLSRNFRSSRAVPVAKMIEEVRGHPFIPLQFLQNKPGMQGGEPLDEMKLIQARETWYRAARYAARKAELLNAYDVHKQFANRLLEPFLYVHGVVSATEWDNFFKLRCHKDAQPEFKELADAMSGAIDRHQPARLDYGHWHLPYVTDQELVNHGIDVAKRLSAARCAWVSYKPFDEAVDVSDLTKAMRTFEKLAHAEPMHASPMEHVASPAIQPWPGDPSHLGNFKGWFQFRHELEGF